MPNLLYSVSVLTIVGVLGTLIMRGAQDMLEEGGTQGGFSSITAASVAVVKCCRVRTTRCLHGNLYLELEGSQVLLHVLPFAMAVGSRRLAGAAVATCATGTIGVGVAPWTPGGSVCMYMCVCVSVLPFSGGAVGTFPCPRVSDPVASRMPFEIRSLAASTIALA